MVLGINFTREEKIKFLDDLGYRFTIIESQYWEQQGNHDSSGKWKNEYIDCAIKNKETADKNDNIDLVFKEEIQSKLKKFLLSPTESQTSKITID